MAAKMPSRAELFARDGYLRVDHLIRPAQARALCDEAFDLQRTGNTHYGDGMVPRTPAVYGAPPMDALLRRLQPTIEQLSGLRLFPTYSYLRIYKRGDTLYKHKDREACEVSVSLTLGQKTSRPWPLWITGFRSTRPVSLRPGDGLLYRGIECDHWRNRFQGTWQCQVFLHYVTRDGPYARWKYDLRRRLGLPAASRGGR